MADQPKLTVVIPCYNYGRYIYAAIESVLKQDCHVFRLVVVNDGSTDNSVDEIKRAFSDWEAFTDNELLLISQENKGVSAALNTGLKNATGEYIVTFDADDIMAPGRLSLQINYLESHPETGCVGGRFVRINKSGELIARKHKNHEIERYDFERAFSAGLVVGGGLAAYRHDVLRMVGGYDERIKIQDFQITLKVAEAGYYIDILPDVVTYYRKHAGSLSSDYKNEFKYGLDVLNRYKSCPGYQEARAKLVVKALRAAVTDDKKYAWELFKQIPLSQWDKTVVKRFRHFLLKRKSSRH